jgi:hypothetical protein
MGGVQEHFDHVLRQLPVIKQHWGLFVSVAILASGGTWFFDSHRISEYQAHVSFLEDRLGAVQQNQAATRPSQWRRLSDEQRNVLLDSLTKQENKFPTMVVYATAESESRQYAAQFSDLLRASGFQVFQREVPLDAPTDVGLMIGVGDINNPIPEAKKFAGILKDANIDSHYTLWTRIPGADNAPVNFDLYIGPKPVVI